MRAAQLDLAGNLPTPPEGELFAEYETAGGRLSPSIPGPAREGGAQNQRKES